MWGTINLDQSTIIASNGECYEIAGVLIRKDQKDQQGRATGKTVDIIYGMETSFCKANIFPGLQHDIVVTNEKLAYIL